MKSTLSLLTNHSNKYKVKTKCSGLFNIMKIKEENTTILLVYDGYRKNNKTTFTKQAKKIPGFSNPKSIECNIKFGLNFKWKELVSRGD